MTGRFITFEGGEGSGKTTQIARLAATLRARGREVVTTREPGGTVLGGHLRGFLVTHTEDPPAPLAELLLYAADRAHHVETVIRPALARGQVVLCDRYADATVAYQGAARGIDRALIETLNGIATGGLRPVRTLLVDLAPSLGVARSLARLHDGDDGDGARESRFEDEALPFHERVREGYLALAAGEPARFRLVDGAPGPDEVQALVWRAVEDLF